MSKEKLHILQHALGVDMYGQGQMYRNHFVTGRRCDDWEHCMSLCRLRLMVRRPPSALTGNDYCFLVTTKGKEVVREHSPKPPTLTKTTRSKSRYRRYLSSEVNMSFGDWIKSGYYKHYEESYN
jgi:hypothetical protein